MRRITWESLVTALALVRLGQELGTDSQATRTIRDLIDLVVSILR